MKTSYSFLLCYLILISSCNFSETNRQNENSGINDTLIKPAAPAKDALQTTQARARYSKIIKIDYQKNKEILELLPLIPDSAMASWEWKKEEREEMVRSIAANNQFTDTTENFNTIVKLTPNYFKTGVVDGSWSASLYKVSENHYIVLTNDMVGDGNEIKAFELKDKQIVPINLEELIGSNPGNLLLKNNSEKCKSVISEEEMGMFTYDFSDPVLVSISCQYLTEKADNTCFKGNELLLKFNEKSKSFDFVKIVWRNFRQ